MTITRMNRTVTDDRLAELIMIGESDAVDGISSVDGQDRVEIAGIAGELLAARKRNHGDPEHAGPGPRRKLEDVFSGQVELTARQRSYVAYALDELYMRGAPGFNRMLGDVDKGEFHRDVYLALLGQLRLSKMVTPDDAELVTPAEHRARFEDNHERSSGDELIALRERGMGVARELTETRAHVSELEAGVGRVAAALGIPDGMTDLFEAMVVEVERLRNRAVGVMWKAVARAIRDATSGMVADTESLHNTLASVLSTSNYWWRRRSWRGVPDTNLAYQVRGGELWVRYPAGAECRSSVNKLTLDDVVATDWELIK